MINNFNNNNIIIINNIYKYYIMIIAHRGHSDEYIDNTELSFISAMKMGFNMIELDINICKSKELVVYHDTIINGKNIEEYTLNELSAFNIITLYHYFKNINKNKIKTYIDIKGNNIVVNYLINFLNYNTFIDKSLLYIASFNITHLEELSKQNFNSKLGLITSNKLSINDINLMKYDFYAFNWETYDNSLYHYLNYKNKQVFLYTCHNELEYYYIKVNYMYDGLVSNIFIK